MSTDLCLQRSGGGLAVVRPDKQPDLQFDLPDPTGAGLTVSISSPDCEMATLFKYTHRYFGYGDTENPPWGQQPDVVCEWTLHVWYKLGLVDEVTMSMHIIIPSRLGQRVIYGCDVSPGAKTYFQFKYEWHPDGYWRLRIIEKGARERIDIDELLAGNKTAMLQPIEFPFPIPDRIMRDGAPGQWYGGFHFPFRFADFNNDGSGQYVDEIRRVEFPADIRKFPKP